LGEVDKAQLELLQKTLETCRSVGLRRTKALEEILGVLIHAPGPMTLNGLANALEDRCDKATVYRLLIRLEEKCVIRRLGFHDRSAHYAMRYLDRHDDYLICTGCGSVESLDIHCPVEVLEREISSTSGFTNLYHELQFYGVCPACTG
jgi:Fur family ferric uptake transcriptional regulator